MDVVFHVFNAHGERMGEWTKAHLENVARAFAFNGETVVTLNVPRTLAKEEMGHRGNLVVAESDTGVELWGGVIRGPQRWSISGVEIQVRSWEAFLAQQSTPIFVAYSGMTAGRMAGTVVADLLGRVSLPLEIGQVDDVGTMMTRDFRLEDIASVVGGLAGSNEATRAFDWWIETDWDAYQAHPKGILYITEKAGRDAGVQLSEGANILGFEYTDDDDAAVTHTIAIGGGGIWGERAVARAIDNDLVRDFYWQRSAAIIREDLEGDTALQRAARDALFGYRKNLVLSVGNQNGEWGRIRSGDTVRVFLSSAGYNGLANRTSSGYEPVSARVVGREVDESRGVQTLQLVL